MSERATLRTKRIDDEVTGYEVRLPEACGALPLDMALPAMAGEFARWLVEAWDDRDSDLLAAAANAIASAFPGEGPEGYALIPNAAFRALSDAIVTKGGQG